MTHDVKVRFAPSPTGRLHVGNARIAIVNYIFAKHQGGQFMLRMDDTDRERSTTAFETGIIDDLTWLGLDWDMFARQSERHDRYMAARDALKADGRLYACYETPEELALKRKMLLSRGRPPVYDRAGLKLTAAERDKFESEGRQPHWRFLLEDTAVAWQDLARGDVHFQPGHLSDPVLLRADGRPLYTLSSVVDDGEMTITHIMRGEDHVANTAVQVQLFTALGFAVPSFAHLPLLVGADGQGLSKRHESFSLQDLKHQGIEPLALAAYLTRLGSPVMADNITEQADLLHNFDIGGYGRASPRFDPTELQAVNGRVLHGLSFEKIYPRLKAMGLTDANATFWACVGGNIEKLTDCRDWWKIIYGDMAGIIAPDDQDFIKTAAKLLPQEWAEGAYKTWINDLKAATGRKGKALFMPLRMALTARQDGPELAALLPLMGHQRTYNRLLKIEA